MVDPTLSHDLPPFLTPDPGLNSGLMIADDKNFNTMQHRTEQHLGAAHALVQARF